MKNARPQNTETSALEQRHFNPFALSLRQARIVHALLARPRPRDQIDIVAGASNGPDEILRLRSMGLDIPCARVPCFDRDGKEVQRGIYCLTAADRQRIRAWLSRQTGSIDAALAGLLAFGVACAVLLMGAPR